MLLDEAFHVRIEEKHLSKSGIRQSMIILISDLFTIADKIPINGKKKIAFIPNAKDMADDKSGIEKQRLFLQDMGHALKDVDLNNYRDDLLYHELSKYEVIYVAGGNCFVLLEKMRSAGFENVVRRLLKNGVVYIGQSAGACVMGSSIEPLREMDNPKLAKIGDYKGLGFVDFVFVPHYKNAKYEAAIAKIEKRYGKKFKLEKFTDSEWCVVDGDSIKRIQSC